MTKVTLDHIADLARSYGIHLEETTRLEVMQRDEWGYNKRAEFEAIKAVNAAKRNRAYTKLQAAIRTYAEQEDD